LPLTFGSVPDLKDRNVPNRALVEQGFAHLLALAANPATNRFLGDSLLYTDNKHAQPVLKRAISGMLAAIGRMQAFPHGLGGRNGPGKAIAATQGWLWRQQGGLMGENDSFDGASYTIMLAALGGRVPAKALETARHASLMHYATFEQLQNVGPIMKDCLQDREALMFNLDKVVRAQAEILIDRVTPRKSAAPYFSL
jgi:hypothetical protein